MEGIKSMLKLTQRAPHEHTVGREDRLVRGCVALSLALMAVFAVLASGGIGLVALAFLALAGFFGYTAATGWDPWYIRFGIDTRATARDDEEDSAVGQRIPFRELRHAGSDHNS